MHHISGIRQEVDSAGTAGLPGNPEQKGSGARPGSLGEHQEVRRTAAGHEASPVLGIHDQGTRGLRGLGRREVHRGCQDHQDTWTAPADSLGRCRMENNLHAGEAVAQTAPHILKKAVRYFLQGQQRRKPLRQTQVVVPREADESQVYHQRTLSCCRHHRQTYSAPVKRQGPGLGSQTQWIGCSAGTVFLGCGRMSHVRRVRLLLRQGERSCGFAPTPSPVAVTQTTASIRAL